MELMNLTRRAQIGPRTLDLSNRTAEAVISTGQAVERRGYRPDGSFGPWVEKLDVAGADLSRLSGAPVLLDHRAEDSTARVGVVETAWIVGGNLMARLKFSARPEVSALLKDLSEGIGGALSIGYSVQEWTKS